MAEAAQPQAALVAEDQVESVIDGLRQRARDGENPLWIPAGQTDRIVSAMMGFYDQQYRLAKRAGQRVPRVTREEILSGQCSVYGVKIEFEKDSRYDCSEMD